MGLLDFYRPAEPSLRLIPRKKTPEVERDVLSFEEMKLSVLALMRL
jgi:hypothetical protein